MRGISQLALVIDVSSLYLRLVAGSSENPTFFFFFYKFSLGTLWTVGTAVLQSFIATLKITILLDVTPFNLVEI
jgi:hypothetical protein